MYVGMFVLVIGILLWISTFAFQTDGDAETESIQPIMLSSEGQPTMGSPDAPVKIIEFADFKCPQCKQFHMKIFPELKSEYIDTGKVQFTYINVSEIGPDSETASYVGEAIFLRDPKAFWDYCQMVYKEQGSYQSVWATKSYLFEQISKNMKGISLEQLSKDVNSSSVSLAINLDNQLMKKANLKAVPAILVNGKPVKHVLDFDDIEKAIREAEKEK